MSTVAFDVDGTLIDENEQPRWPVIDLLRAFHALGWQVIVWSGGGMDYASHWTRKLGLWKFVTYCAMKDVEEDVDLAIDDAAGTSLGRLATIIV